MYDNTLSLSGYLSSINTSHTNQLLPLNTIENVTNQNSPQSNNLNYCTPSPNTNNHNQNLSTNTLLIAPPPPCLLTPHQAQLCYYFNRFNQEQVELHKSSVSTIIKEIMRIADDILKEVENQEPRFINSLKFDANNNETTAASGLLDCNSYDGVRILSPTQFEIILLLNQMGVFNFVDDGTVPGCAVLKLSDGRKRSMSLWVEFITASGYLSARKIRSRFQSLIGQAIESSGYRDIVQLISDSSEVKLQIHERYTLQITPAFRCGGMWPRSASHWPVSGLSWPGHVLSNEVKSEGFSLLSREPIYTRNGGGSNANNNTNGGSQDKNSGTSALLGASGSSSLLGLNGIGAGGNSGNNSSSSSNNNNNGSNGNSNGGGSSGATAEGDAWLLDFHEAEQRLLDTCPGRRQALAFLETLRDRCLSSEQISGNSYSSPVTKYHVTTLLLFECEKHPHDSDWTPSTLPDRINGVLLQLICCLQNRRCPHYFLAGLDLFRGRSPALLDQTAKRVWSLLRDLITSPRCLEKI